MPEFREKEWLKMLQAVQKKPRTIEQLMARFDLSRRTAFRWIEYAETEGYDVIKRGSGEETTYQILDSDGTACQ